MADERETPPGSGEPPAGTPPPPPYAPYPGSYPPPPAFNAYPMPPGPYGGGNAPRNGLGIAALAVGVVALLLVWSVVFGLAAGICAVVLGFLALGRYNKGEATNKGVAISGIALGAIAMVLSLVFVGIWMYFGQRWFDEIGGNELMHCIEQAGDDPAAQQLCQEEFERHVEDSFGVTPTR